VSVRDEDVLPNGSIWGVKCGKGLQFFNHRPDRT
jgi:hypothetical protein